MDGFLCYATLWHVISQEDQMGCGTCVSEVEVGRANGAGDGGF